MKFPSLFTGTLAGHFVSQLVRQTVPSIADYVPEHLYEILSGYQLFCFARPACFDLERRAMSDTAIQRNDFTVEVRTITI